MPTSSSSTRLPPRRFARLLLAALTLGGCGADTDAPTRDEPVAEAQVAPAASEAYQCGLAQSPAAPTLVDYGHAQAVETIVRSGDRVISADVYRWIYWDTTSRQRLAEGAIPGGGARLSLSDLVGDVLMTPTDSGFALRSARDASVRATVQVEPLEGARGGLAHDGSYAYVATTKALRIYAPDGALRFDVPGDFSQAEFFPAPTHLRIGEPEAVREVSLIDGKLVALPPHQGLFWSWFDDGEHFITLVDEAEVQVWTRAGRLVRAWPGLRDDPLVLGVGGAGNFVWTSVRGGWVAVHRIDTGERVQTFLGTAVSAGSTHRTRPAFQTGPSTLMHLDLRGERPTRSVVVMPAFEGRLASLDAQGNWAAFGRDASIFAGNVADRTRWTSLGCGRVVNLSSAGRNVAIASGDGSVRVFEIGAVPKLLRLFEGVLAEEVALAKDGSVLVVRGPLQHSPLVDHTVRVYDVASGALLSTLPAPAAPGLLRGFAVSPSGEQIARVICTGTDCSAQVTDLQGKPSWSAALASSPNERRISLSPTGALLVVGTVVGRQAFPALTLHRADAAPVTLGSNLGFVQWLDDRRGLASNNDGARIFDAQGALLATQRPNASTDSVAGPNPDYYPSGAGRISKIGSGALVWSLSRVVDASRGHRTGHSAIVAGHVVFHIDSNIVFDKLP